MNMIALTVNQRAVQALAEPRTNLADFVREKLDLTGTHLGCEHGVCGACTVAMEDFIVGALESALGDGEIVEAIHVPAMPASAHWGYAKSCRKTGEFAHAIGAILIDPSAATARVVIGAIESAPIIITNAAELFGGRIAGDYKDRFDAHVADVLLAKAGVSNAAHRHIHVNVLKRAVREAAA